jgi:cellulose synthase/poly-beta-1,6-N-acetylglucosamine synthase-like glycosyltransferase
MKHPFPRLAGTSRARTAAAAGRRCLRALIYAGLPLATLQPEPLLGAQHSSSTSIGVSVSAVGTASAVLISALLAVLLIMAVYGIRHFVFTINRMAAPQRHPYIDVALARWPLITVFIAAHNEEKVIAGCLESLLDSDYPQHLLKLIPVNDRSSDGTAAIIDSYAARFPGRIAPFHRTGGKPGKAAALKDALQHAEGDIAIIFDADYVPGTGLLKQLVAPFFDPEVGAVMGRVVPINCGTNLLTRLLDLERSAGYQVDQQARMNMNLVPQYGGTVGGVRLSAVEAVGGWRHDTLAEDTDITVRLMLNGWKTVYSNRSECYEEVPEEWPVRIGQVKRWAKGHNQVMVRYLGRFATSSHLTPMQRIDGVLLLFVFVLPLVMLVGWFLAVCLYFVSGGELLAPMIPLFALLVYGTLGNFAAFYEILVAVLLDGNRKRLRLLPLNLLGFTVSLFAISDAAWSLMLDHLLRRELVWTKTLRYRSPEQAK